jgi:hypothetical protein
VENNYENGSFCPHCHCRILFDDICEYFMKTNINVDSDTNNIANSDTY